ncbi:hypothetical protein, partial [Nocardia sp. NPDC004722]
RGRRSLRALLACLMAGVFGIGLGIGAGWKWNDWRAPAPYHPRMDSPLMAYSDCAEAREPDPATPIQTLYPTSTALRTPIMDREVALRAQRHPKYGWIVWADFVVSKSDRDRLWLSWGYEYDPSIDSKWRDCAQPITTGHWTPAVEAFDNQGRPRWFQACGQVPPEDRGSRRSGVFCTRWEQPT